MTVMAWFKKERKPKTAPRARRDIPADTWGKCESCGHLDIREKFERALSVCPECGYHMYLSARDRIKWVLDEGTFEEWDGNLEPDDPLDFEDHKKYKDRLVAEHVQKQAEERR